MSCCEFSVHHNHTALGDTQGYRVVLLLNALVTCFAAGLQKHCWTLLGGERALHTAATCRCSAARVSAGELARTHPPCLRSICTN